MASLDGQEPRDEGKTMNRGHRSERVAHDPCGACFDPQCEASCRLLPPDPITEAVERQRDVGHLKPRLLDLFCGAGGATKGYQRAGFYVVGIDLHPQPNYCGDHFIQADALEYLSRGWATRTADVIHASPPCQRHSAMTACRPGLAEEYPDLIAPVREALRATGLPYIIENVVGAPLIDPVMLCGRMFGRELYRHRLFEVSGFTLPQPEHHGSMHLMPASKAGHWKPGTVMSVAGHVAPIAHARRIMDIDWMTRDELGEAIPPYFTEHIGRRLLRPAEAIVA